MFDFEIAYNHPFHLSGFKLDFVIVIVTLSIKNYKMESLALFLEPYKDLISNSAATVTYLHQLSGAVICKNIYKQKSTVGFSVLPFLAGLVM